ncbi:MAG TPA: hypothetical protein VIT45_00110 [Allosphingosinicella sp.]
MDVREEFDWHMRYHRLGRVGPQRLEFDWYGLLERRLILIPNFEQASGAVYDAVRRARPAARFLSMDCEPAPVPDPLGDSFHTDVECAITSLADPDGDFAYLSFYTEEAYLAVTPEASQALFGEHAFDLLARAWANCVSQDILRMRRHRHGVRIFLDALRHFNGLRSQRDEGWSIIPDSVIL